MPAPAFEHIGNRADGWGPIVGRGDDYDDRHRREAGKKKKVCSGLHLWKSQFQYKKIRERERMFQQYCGMFCGTVCARKNPTAKNQQQRMHGILFTPFLAESSVLTSPAAEFKAASCQTDLPKNGINERVCSYEYIN